MIKAKLFTAEELTGIEECHNFGRINKWSYASDLDDIARKGEVLKLESISDLHYDYTICGGRYHVKKEWLYDIEEEVDWNAINKIAKIKDVKVFVKNREDDEWIKKYLDYEKDGIFYCFGDGMTRWTDTIGNIAWNYCKLAKEGE